jgi:CubicO group peptidase (beta-lactamase class C family)
MKAWATPGASIAVIDGFETKWQRGFGVRTSGTRGQVTTSTRFQAASLSKPVFALAVLRLVQDGRLDLDADVNNYLRSWRVPANGGWQPRITLRQVLSHTAGVTVDGFRGYSSSERRPTLKQVLRGAAPSNSPPILVDVLPGVARRYSGGGTTIAQQVVLDVMRRSFDELMDELVLAPLGMAHSTFAQPLPRALARDAATAHPWNGEPLRGRWHIYPEQAAAGLWTTAGDLARLGAGLMRALHEERGLLGIGPDLLREVMRPQLKGVAAGSEFASLGWSCSGANETFCLSHGGSNRGFASLISLLPASGKGVVILLNSNQGAPLRHEIRAAVAREYGWPVEFTMNPVTTAG